MMMNRHFAMFLILVLVILSNNVGRPCLHTTNRRMYTHVHVSNQLYFFLLPLGALRREELLKISFCCMGKIIVSCEK